MKYNKLYHMVAALLVVMLLVLTACSSDAPQPQSETVLRLRITQKDEAVQGTTKN